jgi:hypothetical protein
MFPVEAEATVAPTAVVGVSVYDEGCGASGAGLMLKVKLPVVLTGVCLMIFRKPVPGMLMQSNGLLLPPLPADGYEQTFTRTTAEPVGAVAVP